MAENSSNIKKWANLTAGVSVAYSIICIGIEFITAWHSFTGVRMLMTILYFTNMWTNWIIGIDDIKCEKIHLIFWFGFTLFLLIIRLACTNYSNLSIGILVFTIFVNVYMLFVLLVILLLNNKMNYSTTGIDSSLNSNHNNLHNDSDSGGLSSSRNINNDSQIAFGTAPTLNDLNNDSQNNFGTSSNFTDLNNESHNMARSADINIIYNVNDPPPSYDDVMNLQNGKF
ncbi:uncharacterized protein LOC133844438 [Drosophila sulfurigaster albostrigata]|uniref:uncharacterized protein LOC133844438 n=1 Tax=Drosophila sulfurigaster albostrigata TaxID=89887 RepID=UPI002D21ACF5|nr:uncharacterized protein LOC133844438 [Drosophila sulfurigaster albostrigata]